jgi:hypothetical protein
MPDEEPLSVDAFRQYQRGIARWENEGGSGVPAETGRSEAPAPDKHPLQASADSTDRAGSIERLDVAAPRDVAGLWCRQPTRELLCVTRGPRQVYCPRADLGGSTLSKRRSQTSVVTP